MSYYLLPPVNHQQAYYPYFNYNGQSKAKSKLHHKPVECLECRNSKSTRQKLSTFGCKYLNFYIIYGLETLRIYLYSPSLAHTQF